MPKSPLITIVGVPNTGKSTLFNRILGQKKALVHSSPGMTRDIFKKEVEILGKQYDLQDSGGFFLGEGEITEEINIRIRREASRSDLVIFLLDGRRDLLGYEKDLYLEIRKTGTPILAVVNKVDNPGTFILPETYYELGSDYLYISADHNLGLDELGEEIADRLSERAPTAGEGTSPETRISIVGKPNVGKSSLVNRFLREKRVIVSAEPGTTRDSIDLELTIDKKRYVLVDNAGIRKMQKVREDTESAAVVRAEKNIRLADVILYVVDLSRKIDHNDLFIARKIIQSAKPVVIAANKWDLASEKMDAQAAMRKLRNRFNQFYFAPMVLVSAENGKNIHVLVRKVTAINEVLAGGVKTARLNQIIRGILCEKKLLLENNRIFNPKYVSVESTRPFFIRFYAGRSMRLKSAAEIYLKKRLVEELKIEGVPIFFNILGKSK